MIRVSADQAKPVYLTDVEAKGHEVVHLPVAHCELNPIELAWAHVKEYVQKQNKEFTMAEIQQLTPTGIGAVTPTLWSKYVEHVRVVEDKYWEECLEQWIVMMTTVI